VRKPKRPAILLACALALAAAACLYALRYSHAAAWRLSAAERAWVERTLDVAVASAGRTREEFRRTTRPRLWRHSGRLCVLLATHHRHADGSFRACYDERDGRLVEEREYGPTFGSTPLTDPLWELVW
jgi:hypothetical protein